MADDYEKKMTMVMNSFPYAALTLPHQLGPLLNQVKNGLKYIAPIVWLQISGPNRGYLTGGGLRIFPLSLSKW